MELQIDLSSASLNAPQPLAVATAAIAEPMATSDDDDDDDNNVRQKQQQKSATLLEHNKLVSLDDNAVAVASVTEHGTNDSMKLLKNSGARGDDKMPDDFAATAATIISEAVPVVVVAAATAAVVGSPTAIGSDIFL